MNNTILIILCLSLPIAIALIAWPRHGLWARWQQTRESTRRIRREDALKHLLKCEANRRPVTLNSLAGALQITAGDAANLLDELCEQQFVTLVDGRPKLSPSGREIGLHVIRAHRLWESHLAEHTGVTESEWHARAERKEHRLTPEQADDLAAALGYPEHDPHGDTIPQHPEELESDADYSLNRAQPDSALLITHIEDEPASVYQQLLALGLHPGMKALVIEKTPLRVRLWAEGNELVLAPIVAENVSVKRLPDGDAIDFVDIEHLSDLRHGQQARVVGLSQACRGQERRRLLDFGFVPGSVVEVDMVSPIGDPTAYRVRGTVVALRREQAAMVHIASQEPVPA